MVELPKQGSDKNSDSIDEDKDLMKQDFELLEFQKQRSTPRVSLIAIGDAGEEEEVLEVDNFGQMSGQHMNAAQNSMGMGLGTEEYVVKALERTGSLDPDKIVASPMLRPGGPLDEDDEKEE